MSEKVPPLTPAQARSWFDAAGVSITAWAKEHGFAPHLVYSILSGRTRGCRGDAHRVAIALGIKVPPSTMTLGPTSLRERNAAPIQP